MTRTGTVNYHVHRDHRQAFEIDAGGVAGRFVSPELVAREVPVRDVRSAGVQTSFAEDGIAFATAPTEVASFESGDWQERYNRELTALLTQELGAAEVVIFDHTVRVDDPNALRRPARNVHSDYSPDGAHQRMIDVLGRDRAAEWQEGHAAFVNVWRPVEAPVNTAPLGFIRPKSVAPEDWVLIDLIYPDRLGHIMGLVENPEHEWLYCAHMRPDEVVMFNIFDTDGRASVAHSALDLTEDPSVTRPRKSIESRTLVRY